VCGGVLIIKYKWFVFLLIFLVFAKGSDLKSSTVISEMKSSQGIEEVIEISDDDVEDKEYSEILVFFVLHQLRGPLR